MKYLSHYTEAAQTKLFDECGAFFAFNQEQFREGCEKVGATKENKIISFGAGGYVLHKNKEKLIDGLENIQEEGIKQDLKENGVKKIIHRELGNYECQIDGDITRVIEALEDYKITEDQIIKEYAEFYQNCVNNDWF